MTDHVIDQRGDRWGGVERPQTRDEIRALLEGAVLYLRDTDTNEVKPSPWLAGWARIGERSAAERIAAMHPDDRPAYFDGFLEILDEPDRVTGAEYRITGGDGGWATEHATFVNLLDHPDVQALVIAISDEGLTGGVIAPMVDGSSVAFDTIPWVSLSLNRYFEILRVEGDPEGLVGRRADELVGHLPGEFGPPGAFGDVVTTSIRLLQEPGGTCHIRGPFAWPDGRESWFEGTFVNRLDTVWGDILLTCIDINDRRMQEEQLRTSHEQFRMLADEFDAAAVLADADGCFTFTNEQWASLPGAADARWVGDLVDPSERDAVVAELLGTAANERRRVNALSCDGESTLAIRWRAVAEPGDPRRGFLGIVTDISDVVRLERRATRDVLTGLLNRQSLDEHLARAIDEDPHRTIVVFIDLDGFKDVNDAHGHAVGDKVLAEVARRLAEAVRPGDVVGRYGGDEFVVVFHDSDRDTRRDLDAAVVQRLATSLVEPVQFEGGSWTPGASMGTARPMPGEPATRVLERADLAMFATKRERHRLRLARGDG